MDCSVLLIHFIIGKYLLMVITAYGNFHFVASLFSALLIYVVSFSMTQRKRDSGLRRWERAYPWHLNRIGWKQRQTYIPFSDLWISFCVLRI